jgi:hypothetical protein
VRVSEKLQLSLESTAVSELSGEDSHEASEPLLLNPWIWRKTSAKCALWQWAKPGRTTWINGIVHFPCNSSVQSTDDFCFAAAIKEVESELFVMESQSANEIEFIMTETGLCGRFRPFCLRSCCAVHQDMWFCRYAPD